MAFLRNLLATILGLFIFCLLGFFIMMGVFAAAGQSEKPTIEDNSVLALKLSGMLQERTIEDPFEDIFSDYAVRSQSLKDILAAINFAKTDPQIQGIYLESQFLSGGYASLQEIRDALVDFSTSGKFIYGYGEYMSEGDYYLASVADSLILNPEGSVEFNGLSVNITFWKGMFDKLGIQPQIFRVGEFKSYVEPFQQKKMSEANRTQLSSLLNSIYDFYLTNVAASRGKDREELKRISSKMSIQLPVDAVETSLVDRLGYKDEVMSMILREVEEQDVDDIKFVSYQKYSKAKKSEYSSNKIAVIVAQGDIVMSGDENTSIIGSKIAREIRKARESSSVKAIVLRVNSPGGSLTASDIIWREVQKTRGVKPIIASMSDVAASGGYYISMMCDTIVAQPNTITGSIGIFGMLFNIDPFLSAKLGITHDVVKTGDHSDIMTVTRDLTEYEESIIQKSVNKGYQTFINKVALGRNMEVEEVEKVASGRVWSGMQAKENGLVDVIGSFDDAIRIAAEKAGVAEDFRVSYYPRQQPFMQELISKLSEEVKVRWYGEELELLDPYIYEVKKMIKSQGVQAKDPNSWSF
jgi:protease-4